MYNKFIFMLMVFAVAGLAVPANAEDPNYYLPGDWDWDPGGNQMTNLGGGIYSKTFTDLTSNARYTFKVTDGTWDWALPGPGNSWAYANGANTLTVTFNTNTVVDGWLTDQYRMGVNTDPGSWNVVGDLASGGYSDWNNNDPCLAMADQGGGIYKATLTLTTGTYNWKTVNSGTWDAISESERSVNSDNASLTVVGASEDWDFYVDAYTGVVQAVPEPATMALLGLGGLALLRRKR